MNPIEKLKAKAEAEAKRKEKEAQKKIEETQNTSGDIVSLVDKNEIFITLKDYDMKLVEESELNNFLNQKSKEVATVQAKSSLILGKIFSEVNVKLSGSNHHDGYYGKWLEANGYNKKTALRHRKRYELWSEAKTEASKNLMASISVRLIEDIYSSEIKDEILMDIDNGKLNSKIDIAKLLEEAPTETVEVLEAEKKRYNFSFYETVFSYEKKIKKLKPELKEEAIKELTSLEKEIKRLKKIVEEQVG